MNVTNMYKYKKSCCYIYIDLLFFFTNEYVVDSGLHRAMNLYNLNQIGHAQTLFKLGDIVTGCLKKYENEN